MAPGTRHFIRVDLAYTGELGSVMKQLHHLEHCATDLKFELRGSAVGERESDVAGPVCKTCKGLREIQTGECREAMSGPTCLRAGCPPCWAPETEPCPDCKPAERALRSAA